jgi:CheY-like chemotaxis protein
MTAKQELPRYRVVIAEDNSQVRELLKQQLVELGHEVAGEARDGLEVVGVVARARPDVVVIDWGLPVQHGLAAAAAIAQRSPTAIVLLSAYVAGDDPEAEARAAGAHVFVAKPYLIEELDEALEKAVKRFVRSAAAASTPHNGADGSGTDRLPKDDRTAIG